ncbi:MAG: two-component system, OmpR family, sensor histidine kinase KdpD [Solirubrobacteraceae bacterium]|jgi:two-component system sensor histidine kinase KdpD|nr:two-component system, OmpR family, sensor histidine kinase KdpD [Solirubrobacteraceae bacterium]
MNWPRPKLLGTQPPAWWVGGIVSLAAVGLITALIDPLRQVSPIASDSVLYLPAVLLAAAAFGLWLGLLTSLISAAAFNFFYIPPVGHFTIASNRDWVGLGVFLVAAVLASSLADLARSHTREAELRRREADLAAEMARVLLGGTTVEAALGVVARRLAETLDLSSAAVELRAVPGDDRRLALPLELRPVPGDDRRSAVPVELQPVPGDDLRLAVRPAAGDGRVGTLLVPVADARAEVRLRERVVPALEALLTAALERESLQEAVVETHALRRSDEIKTALLRSVSHDLRTPLTAIVTAGEMLSTPGLGDSERAELAAAVAAEAERMSDLVDKLLDLSRLHAGTAVPRRDWCSIEELLDVALDNLRGGRDGFVLSVERGMPLIRADAVQIERALANLLENAARFNGGHPVSVRARVVGRRLSIRIVDRGPGVPKEELGRVFEPFYRGRDASADHRGSGLGLAITKGFVEANGGRVWAESLPGQGSTFALDLPLDDHPVVALG